MASRQDASEEMRLMRFPAVHGDTIVFTYASDLWVADKDGGYARRLTSHPGDETRARISPDGKWVAFSATYDGDPDAYVMPIEGGPPRRLTFDPYPDAVLGWTPDGKIAYASANGNFTTRQARLWLISPDGGVPQKTVLDEIGTGSFFEDGHRLAYTRFNSQSMNWRRYRGGSQGKVSIYDFAKNSYEELPSKRENSWYPMPVGEDIYYASDRNQGTVNLYRYDLRIKKDEQVTHYSDEDIKWPSTDGKTIVYEHDGYLYKYDLKSGDAKKVNFRVRFDELAARAQVKSVQRNIQRVSISPSGIRVAVEARGEIFNVGAKGSDVRNITNTPGAREMQPHWSPNGDHIAYLSDKSSEFQIWLQPNPNGDPVKLTAHMGAEITDFDWSPDSKQMAFRTRDNSLYTFDVASRSEKLVLKSSYGSLANWDWSPDGKWLVFNDALKNGFNAIFLHDIANAKTTQVTSGLYDDQNPTFDLSGKYLYFNSARTLAPTNSRLGEITLAAQKADRIYMIPLANNLTNPLFPMSEDAPGSRAKPAGAGAPDKGEPAPTRIDIDRMEARTVVLPMAAGDYILLIGGNESVLFSDGASLQKFDLKSRDTQPIMAADDGFSLSFNPTRTKFAYAAHPADPIVGVTNVQPGNLPMAGRINLAGMTALVDPEAEWKQMFWESWRYERDNFYDPAFLGLDWKGIGEHYAKFLTYIRHRSELSYVQGLMIGEFGTSHSYVNGPPPDGGAPPSAASLGADYTVEGNNLRIAKILRGLSYMEGRRGPLSEPGLDIHEGDYLLAIDGKPVNVQNSPGALLIDKANRVVTLTVNTQPSMAGARQVRVRPIGSEQQLRYYEWVENNRRKVSEMSHGRIAYIHYPDTGANGQMEFMRTFWGQTDKDAAIIDDRWNGGGNVQPFVVPTFARQSESIIVSRNSSPSPEIQAINGPKVMLINGYAGSGGDLTPWYFRDMGVGPIIGKRTWGGLVGIQGTYQLMDGGGITSPAFAFYEPKTGKWIAENNGIEPDMDIDRRPDLVAQGHDPQLEKAVQVLMDALAKQKPSAVKRQAFPKVGGGG